MQLNLSIFPLSVVYAQTQGILGLGRVKRHLRACFFARVDNAQADRYRKFAIFMRE